MASFKLSIADPKTGKCFKKEVKDEEANHFLGLNIGESVKGEVMGMTGFEFTLTGGSDYCGFPMRRGIQGTRKKITILKGVGFRGKDKGIYRRKTVCGHKIHDKITQINLSVTKIGAGGLAAQCGDSAPAEGSTESKEVPKEDAKAKPATAKEEKKETPAKEEQKAPPKEEKKPAAESKEETTEAKKPVDTPKAEEKPKEEKK